ncbi:MAG: type II/IV secretion system ATPase subunit [Candidatus Aenigmatarchaeota archaeon]
MGIRDLFSFRTRKYHKRHSKKVGGHSEGALSKSNTTGKEDPDKKHVGLFGGIFGGHDRTRDDVKGDVKDGSAGKAKSHEQSDIVPFPKFVVADNRKPVDLPDDIKSKPITYPLIRPFSYASIKHDPKTESIEYHVVEPSLTEDERALLEKLKTELMELIDVSMNSIKNHKGILEYVEDKIQLIIEEMEIDVSDESYLKIMYYIYRDFVGMNEVEPILRDMYIEDISCDGVGVPLYISHRKYGNLRTNVIFNDLPYLREIVVKMAERCDRYISYADPLLDGSLPDGTRVQATLASDVTSRGPTFSIRKFPERPYSPVDMVKLGTADEGMLAFLWYAIENGLNIIVVGGTSTGKTSLLNTISLFMLPEAKIVSIEDTRELRLPHENWIPGVARLGFAGTKTGEITMFDLLKEAFRQNPDYMIVGEVRGDEASVMFQGMASGISCMSTMHSGSADDALKRLQTRPISLPPTLMETLDILLVMAHARERGKSARRVKEVVEIERVDPSTNEVKTNQLFRWDPSDDSFDHGKNSYTLKILSDEKGISIDHMRKEIKQREKFLKIAVDANLDWKEISDMITLYNRDKIRAIAEMKRRHVNRNTRRAIEA